MRLKKGDRVRVLSGKDRGDEGDIMRVFPKTGMVIVEGVNVAKKHQRAVRTTMQGGIIDKDMPIQASNVAMLCDSCGATRIGYRFEESGMGVTQKVRVCKKCGSDL